MKNENDTLNRVSSGMSAAATLIGLGMTVAGIFCHYHMLMFVGIILAVCNFTLFLCSRRRPRKDNG